MAAPIATLHTLGIRPPLRLAYNGKNSPNREKAAPESKNTVPAHPRKVGFESKYPPISTQSTTGKLGFFRSKLRISDGNSTDLGAGVYIKQCRISGEKAHPNTPMPSTKYYLRNGCQILLPKLVPTECCKKGGQEGENFEKEIPVWKTVWIF